MPYSLYIGYCSEGADRDRSMSGDSTGLKSKSNINRRVIQQQSTEDGLTWIPETSIPPNKMTIQSQSDNSAGVSSSNFVEIEIHQETPSTPPADNYLGISSSTTIITTSSSVDTLTGDSNTLNLLSGPSSPSNLSSVTLVGSTGSGSINSNERDKDLTPTQEGNKLFKFGRAPTSPLPERKRKPVPKDSNNDSAAKKDAKKSESVKDVKQKTTTIATTTTTSPSKITPTVTKTHHDDIFELKITKIETTISSKPTIVSTLAKTTMDSSQSPINGRSTTPSKSGGTVGGLQPNMSYLSMNRRPSAGANVIPVAALCQHRHSLQLNGSDVGLGAHKVKQINM